MTVWIQPAKRESRELAPEIPASRVKSIKATFTQRQIEILAKLEFGPEDLKRLQDYWAAFLRKMKIADAPKEIADVMTLVNEKLKAIRITAQ